MKPTKAQIKKVKDALAEKHIFVTEHFLLNLDMVFDTVRQVVQEDQIEMELSKQFAKSVSTLAVTEDTHIAVNADGVETQFLVKGIIPGTEQIATCRMTVEKLCAYLGYCLYQSKALDKVEVRVANTDLQLKIHNNGLGNISVFKPITVEPNIIKGLVLNVFFPSK